MNPAKTFLGPILIVEDETNLGLTLKEYLKEKGHDVYWASTASEAIHLFQTKCPKLILLDLGLPDGDGMELCQKWKKECPNIPLLILSAQNDPETKVQGLEQGADDYITKPFALKELTLRLERILSSIPKAGPGHVRHGKLQVWFDRYEIEFADGTRSGLSHKECSILELLYEKAGEVVNRHTIISEVWGDDRYPSNRTVDNYIVRLRRWCESDTNHPLEIQSIRGVGYKLVIKE